MRQTLYLKWFDQNKLSQEDLLASVSSAFGDGTSVFDDRYILMPGFCDVHVHFREPGFSYKESMLTGGWAAARGGYTDVCTMPNLSPVPDDSAHLREQKKLMKNSCVRVHPYGAITREQMGEELSAMEELAGEVVAFSDDGRGVQNAEMMQKAMQTARALGKIIVAHCEDNSLLHGGYIHDGAYARANHHRGISSESEYAQIARDLELAAKTGCAYHVCHISAKESVALIAEAKRSGVNVTCETAPHYLVLDDGDLQEDGRFKMNPPLRDRSDKEALLAGIVDGTIDMIATDHAPHSAEEKSRGLEKSAFGIVGLETAFPMLYTHLVLPGVISIDRLTELMAIAPRRRFSLDVDFLKNYSVWDLETEERVDPEKFMSKGKATPFAGMPAWGKCKLTVCDGQVVYRS